jgi:M6 family metalloprotease-like protein
VNGPIATLAAVLALALGAPVVASSSPDGPSAQSPCAVPDLGFGAGEGKNAAGMPPTSGTLRIGMLFLDFADSPGPTEPEALYAAQVPRLVDFYRTVSYGALQLDVKPLARWLRLPRTLAQYQQMNFEGAVEDAVAGADPTFDFSSVDALYLVVAMPSLASTVIDEDPIRADGAAIHSWAWLATGSLSRLPFVAIHETGHILGLPDLYNERVPSSQHTWDVMTAAPTGGGLLAWHRLKLGWIAPHEIRCRAGRGTTDVTLTPVERAGGVKAVISRVGRRAVVVEARGAVAEDARLCRTGVLVYRVDFVTGAPENVGARRRPIELHRASTDDSRRWAECGRDWRASLLSGTTTAWNHRIRVLKRLRDGSYRVRVTRIGGSRRLSRLSDARQISVDPITDDTGQHETAVEPDSFSAGDTVVAAFQIGRTRTAGASSIGWATSRDGGVTWSSGVLPSLTVHSAPPGSFTRATDPAVAYDRVHGTWLISVLGLRDGPGGTTDELLSSLVTSRSVDGVTWSAPVVTSPAQTHFAHDKNWIVCDNGTASPFKGRCYVVWTAVSGAIQALGISSSNDGGLTWDAETIMPSISGSAWQPVVRPNGTVVILFVGARAIRAVRSTDGGSSFGPATTVSSLQDAATPEWRAPALPSAGVDARGRITVAWLDCRFRRGCGAEAPNDVVYSSSANGVRWSRVRRVPTGEALDGLPHFVVGLDVDPTTVTPRRRLGVVFHVLTPAGVVPYFVSSSNDGRGWSAPEPLTPPQPVTAFPEAGTERFLGDYVSTSFVGGGTAVPVFASASDGFDDRYHQGVFAAVIPPQSSPASLRGGKVHVVRTSGRVNASVAVAGLTKGLRVTCRVQPRRARLLRSHVTRSRATCVWRVQTRAALRGALALSTPEADVTRAFVVRGLR